MSHCRWCLSTSLLNLCRIGGVQSELANSTDKVCWTVALENKQNWKLVLSCDQISDRYAVLTLSLHSQRSPTNTSASSASAGPGVRRKLVLDSHAAHQPKRVRGIWQAGANFQQAMAKTRMTEWGMEEDSKEALKRMGILFLSSADG
jgi:hypothetical protein